MEKVVKEKNMKGEMTGMGMKSFLKRASKIMLIIQKLMWKILKKGMTSIMMKKYLKKNKVRIKPIWKWGWKMGKVMMKRMNKMWIIS